MKIAEKTFLITGGGSGLGEATARRLVAGGARVVIADVNEETGSSVAADLGDAARFCRTDVTDEGSIRAAIETAVG